MRLPIRASQTYAMDVKICKLRAKRLKIQAKRNIQGKVEYKWQCFMRYDNLKA